MSFLSKLWQHIKDLFAGSPTELKAAIHIGAVVTDNLQKLVDSPIADVLTAIIPGDADDKVKDLLRAKLPNLLVELKLADACVGLTDPNEITACALKVLSQLDPTVKPAFLHSLSILIAQVAADGKLSWSDGVYLLQWYYDNMYKAKSSSEINS